MNLAFERYGVLGPRDPRHGLALSPYPSTGGGGVAPAGYIFLTDFDGAYLIDQDGYYLVETA